MVQTVETGGLQQDGTFIVHPRERTNIHLGLSREAPRLKFEDRISIASFAYDIFVNLPEEDRKNIVKGETIEKDKLYRSLASLIIHEPGFQTGEEEFSIQPEKGSLREFSHGEIVFSGKDAAINTFLTVLPEGSLREERTYPHFLAGNLLISLLGTGFAFDKKLSEIAMLVAGLRPERKLNEGDTKILRAIFDYNMDIGDHW